MRGLLVLLLAQLAFGVGLVLGGCSASPCSFRNPEYAAHVAVCDARVGDECELDESGRPLADCRALVECKAWAREVCQ